ncbi:hypothetical protein EON81_06410 [bacterium]|nr:MAG: hypothetical protein EON81_06410 [bacterium]
MALRYLSTLAFSALAAVTIANSEPSLIPVPKSVRLQAGTLSIRADQTVAFSSKELAPLAEILAGEIRTATGVRLQTGPKGKPAILLRRVSDLQGEAYRLKIGAQAVVEGGNYGAIAMGTATLLQALTKSKDGLEVPKMSVEDRPDRGYRGLMVDVARKYHRISTLEQCVELCRLYKIRYLQLHLTDDQAYTIPSKAYPKLNEMNSHGGPSYTAEELRGLVRFADARGVTIIPELEVPGHAAILVRAYPELFKIEGTKPYEHHATVNFANAKALAAIETLVGETCEIFGSSPYFHIGGDEADYSNAHEHPDFQAAFKEFDLTGKAQEQIYRRFLLQMNEIVKKRKKRMIVWEGFGRDPESKFQIPKEVAVMEFESAYYLPTELIADGHTVINAAWTPLYVLDRHVWRPEKILEWNLSTFGRFTTFYPSTTWFKAESADAIVGAQTCAWEQPEHVEIANLRRVLPAMSERVWNVAKESSPADFMARLGRSDSLLGALLTPIETKVEGLAALGPDDFDVPVFHETARVSFSSTTPGSTIRFTLDGQPVAATSPVYAEPITLDATKTIRAAAFDASGRPIGYETSNTYYFERPVQKSLATGQPVTVSGGTQGSQAPELAVDGKLDLGSSWWTGPAPQWLQVDLGSVRRVGQIDVYPYWDGRRYYQYTVEVSNDGKEWKTAVDWSANTIPASAKGDSHTVPTTEARYVRVNMLRGNANDSVHLVEFHVWEAKS